MNIKQKQLKEAIQREIFNKLKDIKDILSITLVGSFVDKTNLNGIRDIDTIVICKNLDDNIFKRCIESISEIELTSLGLNNYKLIINSTFGPLKFNEPNIVVIHLMIYDIKRHKSHVTSSPFTTFDWERSNTSIGIRLKDIFPTGTLQFRDFINARRGINNYLADLSNNVISYREYDVNNAFNEIKKIKNLNKNLKQEYAYHIIKNIINNYIKLYEQSNNYYIEKKTMDEIKRITPQSYLINKKMIKELFTFKSTNNYILPNESILWVKEFLSEFETNIKQEWSQSIIVNFIRHIKTDLNNNTFLGQGRNPKIKKYKTNKVRNHNSDLVYTSPMSRCKEMATSLFKDAKIIISNKLNEINYGDAEGLTYKQFKKQFPEIDIKWKQGKDPKFPKGENTKDVLKRLNSFLNELKISIKNVKDINEISVITHNVVLRCLLGNAFNIETKNWHKINIPHNQDLEFLYFNNKYYPNIPRKFLATIFKEL